MLPNLGNADTSLNRWIGDGNTNPSNSKTTREFQQLIQKIEFKNLPEEIKRKIIQIANNDPSLTSLNLRGNNIGPIGAAALAKALTKNTSLTSINLSNNNIGDKGAIVLAEALKVNTSLRAITLVNNNIGDEGAKELAEKAKTGIIINLVNNNNIGNEGEKVLDKINAQSPHKIIYDHPDAKPNHSFCFPFFTCCGVPEKGNEEIVLNPKSGSTLNGR